MTSLSFLCYSMVYVGADITFSSRVVVRDLFFPTGATNFSSSSPRILPVSCSRRPSFLLNIVFYSILCSRIRISGITK
ncbi:uncharacterized protein F4817DRAFT_341944 [Daldinia loculata]|uniref:uncharacterized protein n=1 Tax=Daldinia loculata TaxID=103429 RepID=UPI0020C4018F|nr:uncharacterized protein F4817DRAFT_341944 [Daldinia loculata]KAI1645904.1 hypothetical protein F4817DRAFT_341944 [Daldinia loculata]